MDSVLAFSKDLFAFDAYWKVVVLIFFFGTICAYVFTRSLKETTTKVYLQKGEPVSAWRGLWLTCFSSFMGGAVGIMLDISILPIVAKVGVCEPCPGAAAEIIVPHYYLLSILCGVGAGILSSFSFPFIRGFLANRLSKRNGSKPGGAGVDLHRQTFSWSATSNMSRDDLLGKLAEEEGKREASKGAADKLAEARRLERAAELDEKKAQLERELAKITAEKSDITGGD